MPLTPTTPAPRAGLRPVPPVEAGAEIGRYRVIGRLGVGGMGEVLLARASGAGGFEKDVVIKRILPHLATDPDFVRRFIEEGKLVVKLRHAGIAQVLDMGEDGGVVYLAMEHVDGKDLQELIQLARSGGVAMPRALVMYVLIELLEALDYAHHAKDTDGEPLGLIHRDVTPSNVMVSKSGEVKLLDFGIARATERLKTSVSGAIRGKFGYMSPQQASGLELDLRADLFSVGVIAWELLAGERPFDGASDLLTLDRIRHHEPGPLSAVAPDVPEPLSAWVGQMLAKRAEDRFATAHEAAQVLRTILVSEQATPSGRELARWYEQVVATLPDSLRARPAQGLSLDELLALGLPMGPISGEVAAGTQAANPPTVVAAPPIVTGGAAGPEEKPRRLAMTLLALNVVLIAAVAILIWRVNVADDVPARAGQDVALSGLRDVAEVKTAPDTVTAEVVEAAAPDTVQAAEVVEAPVVAGVAFGEALAALPEAVFEGELELTLRSQPAGATLAVAGFGSGVAPRVIRARRGVVVSGRATLPNHQARSFEYTVGEQESAVISLRANPKGTVRFRYFPAEGTAVQIDGRAYPTQGNVVAVELSTGEHTLTLQGPGGQRVTRRFTVEEGKTANIGTIDLTQ